MIIHGYEIVGRMPTFTEQNRRLIRLGLKTQTRRVINPQPDIQDWTLIRWERYGNTFDPITCLSTNIPAPIKCRYGKPGDARVMPEPIENGYLDGDDYSMEAIFYSDTADILDIKWKWKLDKLPSIFMPTNLGRTIVRYTGIHVEKLQDITDDDALAEGVQLRGITRYPGEAIDGYMCMWDENYGKKHPWEFNPWVWVISWELLR